MNTSDLLENCIQMERIVGQIYGIFMKQQSSCPEYACLWEKTAREEYNHEQQFILAKRMAYSMKTDVAHVPHPSNELVKITGLVQDTRGRNTAVTKQIDSSGNRSGGESFRIPHEKGRK